MQQTFQCPNCRVPVPYGAKFCGNCGTPLNWSIQQQTQPPPVYQQQQQQWNWEYGQGKPEQKKTSPWLIVSIALIAVALLGGGGIFALNTLSQGTPSTTPPPTGSTPAADTTAPVITGVSVSSITETSAAISWVTDEGATSQVEYGVTTDYGSTSTLEQALVVNHSITLSSLDSETTYHYRVKSTDGAVNEAASNDYTFTTPTAAPTESYKYHDYYPIILSLSDSKGNIVKSSQYNQYIGPHHSSITQTSLSIGNEIQWEVEAVDPEGRQLKYNFNSNSSHFNELIGLEGGSYKWTTNNKLTYKISEEDLSTAGETLRIVASIKSEKEYLRFPQGPYDDVIYLDYKLLP